MLNNDAILGTILCQNGTCQLVGVQYSLAVLVLMLHMYCVHSTLGAISSSTSHSVLHTKHSVTVLSV